MSCDTRLLVGIVIYITLPLEFFNEHVVTSKYGERENLFF
ncbi:hypothetical protein SAMN04488034_104213 [Salinimicrobium catena]|uniref:Uncharacterized protein n=1 Tax=Salinimicrobium catena TaxID=390640 RepID=A0A1H5NI62_9FLAO|nr:hypothetical protein SAMN04488140_104213 [Salinimicrobium catena]SEF01329.1 hypothetical protein SAMN04488034_104213 [Salinimicrobium catena]